MSSTSKQDNNVYIAEGVKQDCDKLLDKFCELESYDFNDFLEIWKEMKFSFIYGNLEYYSELLEFTEEVFLIVKHLWIDEKKDFFRSVGAFYTLVGVYQKQPDRENVKIRLTVNDMKSIRSFLETCVEKKLTPIILMFDAMKRSKAFIYVETERQYGLEFSYRKYFTASSETMPIEKDPDLERVGNEVPEVLVNYLEAKKKILDKKQSLSDRLNFLTSDKIEEVVENLSNTIKIQNEHNYMKTKQLSQGEKRKNIKAKAFSEGMPANAVTETEGVDDYDDEDDDNDDDETLEETAETMDPRPAKKKQFWRSKLKYSNKINLKAHPNPESDKNIVLDSFIKNHLNEYYCDDEEIENEEKYVEALMDGGRRNSFLPKCKQRRTKRKKPLMKRKEMEGQKRKKKKTLEKNPLELEIEQVPSTSQPQQQQLKMEYSPSSCSDHMSWNSFDEFDLTE